MGTDEDEADDDKKKNSPSDNPHGLSKSARHMLAKTSGKGRLRVAKTVFKGVPATQFDGDLKMEKGRLFFEKLDFDLYGGHVSGKSTKMDLPPEYTSYDINFDVQNIDLGRALAAHTSLGRIFEGRVSQEIQVKGRGLSFEDMAVSLEGPMQFESKGLRITNLDVLDGIFGPVSTLAKKSGLKMQSFNTDGTELRDLLALFTIDRGRMSLKKAIKTDTPWGSMSVDGGAFLDKRLDFVATANLSPQTIAKWTQGKIKSKQSIPVPLKIGGTWNKPEIVGVDTKTLLPVLIGGAALGVAALAGDEIKNATGVDTKKILESAADVEKTGKKALKSAEDAAKKEAKKAEEQAKTEAKKAAKKAEDAAKKETKKAKKKAKKSVEYAAKKLFGN